MCAKAKMSLHPDIAAVLSGDSEGCIVCGDNSDVMAGLPGLCVGAVVTDPPYGISMSRGVGIATSAPVRRYEGDWDEERPSREVFDLMRKISREQVIFGGNYFADLLPPSPSWISWDKDNGDVPFADVELAWTSHKRAARKVKWRWHGMLQEHGGKHKEARVHPTQKPLGLMIWVVENYTEIGDTILDPFCGSGTTCVAAKKLGRCWIGIDIDEGYCETARNRLRDTERPLFPPQGGNKVQGE